jgi:membrane-associated phospholipid phosphatase
LNNRLALFLSVVLHPLLLPTYILGTLFGISPEAVGVSALSFSARGSLLFLLFLNTFVVPALLIYTFYRLGLIQDLHLDSRRERRLPYLITLILYSLSTYLFGWQFQPISELAPQIAVILGSITVSLAVVALVSLRWKISAHATGMGGCLGALGGVVLRYGDFSLFLPLLISILITGLLISARLRLNAHSPAQVSAGLGVGLFISIAAVFLYF